MFLCKKCHEPEERDFGCTFLGHFSHSRGKCEGCGEYAECVDCKTYKGKGGLAGTALGPTGLPVTSKT